MLRLKNLRKNDNLVECDLYIESDKESRLFVVDIKSEQIVEASVPEGRTCYKNYFAHARDAIIEMAKQGNLPKERTVMWY